MDSILKYFPSITEAQQQQFEMLAPLYEEWNAKINVISRKDIGNLYLHHVLHSLAIAREFNFQSDTNILDFGTGGGFPGIPLAIMFPDVHFKLIDRTAKKIRVAQEVARALGLNNVTAIQLSGEEEKGKYDFVVSRAVMPLPDLVRIVRKNINPIQHNAHLNGLIVLKGGNLKAELHPFLDKVEREPLNRWFEEEWFKEKDLIYLPL